METYKSENKYEKYCGVVFSFGNNELSFWADANCWTLVPTLIFNKEMLPIYNPETYNANMTYTVSLRFLCFRVDFDITATKKHLNHE